MIIRIIATALIQCTVRTHAGWMTFAVAGTVASSLAARLDIAILSLFPSLEADTPIIRREPGLRYCNRDYQNDAKRASRSQKSEPGCPGSRSRVLLGTRSGQARRQDAGISTVSTTWITPFDWLTLEIVTIEVPPLASTIQTLPSWCFTVSSSPSTVLSFLPSVRLEASNLPGTT